MSAPEPMPSARRHPIPGMTSQPATPAPPPPPDRARQPADADASAILTPAVHERAVAADDDSEPVPEAPQLACSDRAGGPGRWPATDYSATRLANFRIPVALLDRYRQLVREAEDRDPRLRRPSVTEVVIGLLQEGPATPEEVAELIRRKRAAEHGLES
jgi:hypothetical protein